MKARVVIVQPYVPAYRVAFFEELRQRLSEKEVECVVAAGVPRGAQAHRGDAARPSWLVPIDIKTLKLGHRSIDLGIYPPPWRQTDAVIVGLEGSSIPAYRALAGRRYSNVRVGLWGHIKPYVAPGNKLDLWLEQFQMRFADHIFAYTAGGRKYALGAGIEPEKITTVMNTVDTAALETCFASINTERISAFSRHLGIDPSRTLCFIGGLDQSKRVDFLASALDELWVCDNRVRLLVGGEGPHKKLLQPAFDRGQAIDVGYLNTEMKALVMSVSSAVAMPGRIGLVAVDALATRTPIVTTDWPYHAPESEYLTEGSSKFTTKNFIAEFVDTLVRVTSENIIADYDDTSWAYPGLTEMVENFSKGVMEMLAK